MKRKRSLFKTFILFIVRYIRWKENPKNIEAYYLMRLHRPKVDF